MKIIEIIPKEFDAEGYNAAGYEVNGRTRDGYTNEFVDRINNMDLSDAKVMTDEEINAELGI